MEAVDTPDVRDVIDRRGPAAHVHGVVRYGAGVRAGRPRDDLAPPRRRARSTTKRSSRRCSGCAIARRVSSRSKAAASITATPRWSISSGRIPSGKPDTHKDVSIELGAKANPPGFDEQLLGLEVGATKTFTLHYPADYPIGELAGTDVSYTVTVKGLKRRVLPELDDEFAKDLGEFETLDALKTRVREDLEHEAKHAAEREDRAELMKQLAAQLPFEVPASLIEREIDRRLEEFARRLIDQNVDPRQAGIDWNAFRESQRDVAREAVAAALVLDEVARREKLDGHRRRARRGGRPLRGTQRPDAGGGARRARKRGRNVPGSGGVAAGEVD